MGKTPPEEEEAEGSPQKKAARVDDAALFNVPVASAPSPTRKTPPKGDEAEGSPRKKAARLDDAARATAPVASDPNPTREAPRKKEAEGSPPKVPRWPRRKSPRRQGKRPAAAVPLPTIPEFSELIVEGAGRASDKKQCKCKYVVDSSGTVQIATSMESLDAWTCCDCLDEDKNGIFKLRPTNRDLLICVTCADHLCCGVGSIAYPFGHSRSHALKKKHWFAVLYCDPERGYCFECNAEVPRPVKFEECDNKDGLQVIRTAVSRKLLAPPPFFGQTEAKVNPEKVETTGKVQAESSPSGFGDIWPSYNSISSDAQGYAIRGMPNLENTCYMNAVLQCLLVLGKLREKMLALDHPIGLLPELLKELFVEASAPGDVLDPSKVLECVRLCKAPDFRVGSMEDSHELLMALYDIWNQGEEIFNGQSDAPTVIDSIIWFQMIQKLSCKQCGYSSKSSYVDFRELGLHFPQKWHGTKSVASPQTSESPRSRKREIPADVLRNLEQIQIVDSTQVQRISQSKDVVQRTEDSLSLEDLLLYFSDDQVEWRCPDCAKDDEKPSGSQSKNDDQIVVRTLRFNTLPPVLALHLNRTAHGFKLSWHVRFTEDLDVERFMDPSSVDKGSTIYRLAGVVEHIGEQSLKTGHYIAYVRARRLGNQQDGSGCSSSWFCANDRKITQVTLEQVLNCQAYLLFYERMEKLALPFRMKL